MSKVFLFTLDLISKSSFKSESLEDLKNRILSLQEDNEFCSIVYDVAQLTKDGRVEIYAEDTGITINSGEEVLSLVKLVEDEVGGFISGSSFEILNDQPGKSEKWVKVEYGWELEEKEEEEENWEDDTYWEDEWNEWNDEWN